MQRACLARALVLRPRWLVCDEMTAMLDAVHHGRPGHGGRGIAGRVTATPLLEPTSRRHLPELTFPARLLAQGDDIVPVQGAR
ncbi:hypothetical protein Saso_04780 [Streptomyces asoensis]|uniref:ABC transporter domain-containing protein n=1 Tax=Streptomyces asoensis TaxID=249586 RepID=A0ABQ3RSI4_9ACTN|nr:hypothetical protein GCM10010496_05710 [Streptomyces asoensis]GHI58828.1 hypothetical protein Saso_04780 [Streptomyces asoensis]